MPRRLFLLALVAFGIAIAYAVYLQPDWEPSRDDQFQYLALARGLADRGELTRAEAGEPFVAEPLRSPGYPVFLALLCRTAGCGNWQVAIAQALLFAALVPLTFAVARGLVAERLALAAAGATALYLPFAYYAALPLSDLLATVLLTAALACAGRVRGGAMGWAVACGAALGGLALTRPLYVALPLVVALLLPRGRTGAARPVIALALVFAALLAPYAAYSLAHFGRPLASSSGVNLWLGYFQGHGGLDAEERRAADAGAKELEAFAAVSDRRAQAFAFVALDDALRERALGLIARAPLEWAARGLTLRSVELWAREEPLRVADAAASPPALRLALTAAQLALVAFAAIGAAALLRARHEALAALAVGVLLYVWLLSAIFWTEARHSLPAKPLLLVAVVAGVDALLRRGRPTAPPVS